jgi:hypothetical protein
VFIAGDQSIHFFQRNVMKLNEEPLHSDRSPSKVACEHDRAMRRAAVAQHGGGNGEVADLLRAVGSLLQARECTANVSLLLCTPTYLSSPYQSFELRVLKF